MSRKHNAKAKESLPRVDRGHTYPMPLWLQLIRWLRATLLVSFSANGAVLIVTVIVMLAVVEADALSLDWRLRDALDGFSRQFVGVSTLAGLFGLAIVFALVHDLYWALLRLHLGRFTDDDANRSLAPVDWQRASYGADENGSLSALYQGFTILSVFSYVLGPIVAIVAVTMIVQRDDTEFALGALAVGVLLVLVPLGVRWILKRLPVPKATVFWGGVKAGSFEPRKRKALPSTELDALVHTSDVTGRVAGVLTAVACLSFVPTMIATFIRQPCQECAPRDLDALGEGVVAFFAGSGAWIVSLTLVPLLLVFVLDAVVKYRLRQRLLSDAVGPDGTPPPWPVLNQVLLEDAPLVRFFILSHVVGLVMVEVGFTGLLVDGSALQIDDGTWWYLLRVGSALIVLGAVFWWFGRDRVDREREVLMERWG